MSLGTDELLGSQEFRVLYQKPGYAAEIGQYYASDLKELLRWLNITEGVEEDTCLFIYIHQILGDGKIAEVYAYEQQKDANVVDIKPRNSCVVTGDYDYDEIEQESVITEVQEILAKVAALKPRLGKIRTGFGVTAYPARSGDYVEE